MPEREPNFNDRLQAMAARAMLLAAQQRAQAMSNADAQQYGWKSRGLQTPADQKVGVRAPAAFPGAGPAKHFVRVSSHPQQEWELHAAPHATAGNEVYRREYNPLTAKKPAAGSTQNRAIERLMQERGYQHFDALLDREPVADDPMHPVSVWGRYMDRWQTPVYGYRGVAHEGDRRPYPYNKVGRGADALVTGYVGHQAYDPGALPVTQGPPTPGFDSEKEAARQLAALFALFPTKE